MSTAPVIDAAEIAVIYARQSKANPKSIEQQIAEGHEVIAEEGWTFGRLYSDGSSASRFATKARADWTQLLADLEAGRFDILILWEPSRGDRRLSTWAAMLEKCQDHGVRIYVISHEKLYDLRKGRDWKALAEDGVDSAYESEKTSGRTKRNTGSMASSGRPHGMVAYGYRRVRVFDDVGRMIDSHDEILPEQADVIRETARRLFTGESLRSIVKHWNAKGITSPKGTPWSSTTLRQVMLRDRNAGLRTHRGKVVGKAKWAPIYDEATHDRVVDLLRDPSRTTGKADKGATRKHLLSGIARCGLCDAPVRAVPGAVTKTKTKTVTKTKVVAAKYQCSQCMRIARRKDTLETVVSTAAIERLARADVIRVLASGNPDRAEELTKLIGDAEAQQKRAMTKMLDGVWTEDQVDILNARLIPQIAAWKAELPACAPHEGVLELAGAHAAEKWDAAPLDVKRAALDVLMTITVLPAGSGHYLDPETAEVETSEDGRVMTIGGQVRIAWR